jgi:hypothetical protein
MAVFAFTPFPFWALETLSGFLRGNGIGLPEREPVSKTNPCIACEDLLTLTTLLPDEVPDSCSNAELSSRG